MLTLQNIIDSGVKLTPMIEQYAKVKKQYPDTLLLFRMGDFYELFFEDAHEASKILNITLTHRGKLGDKPIPMAGIPHHAASTYIDRITACGKKAVICEQIEDPALAQGLVKRAVTQIVSPGMPFDVDRMEKNDNRYIACAFFHQEKFILVVLDFTTGDFRGMNFSSQEDLLQQLAFFSPKEFITFLGQWDSFPKIQTFLEQPIIVVTHLSSEYFNVPFSKNYVEKLIPRFEKDEILKMTPGIFSAVGALSYYIHSTQQLENLCHLRSLRMEKDEIHLKVSYPTLTGLEIFPRTKESHQESLLGFFDHTQTAMGARELKSFFRSPLTSLKLIQERQTAIEYFVNHQEVSKKIRSLLNECRDLERILTKVSSRKINVSDMLNLAATIKKQQEIQKELPSLATIHALTKTELNQLQKLGSTIGETLNNEIGASLEKSNLIRPGVNKERDRLAKLTQDSNQILLKLEETYKKKTGIGTLRIKYNNVNGHFIEVSKGQTNKVPASFERRQTLVNAERYVTAELTKFEQELLVSKTKLEQIEKEIFQTLIKSISTHAGEILKVAQYVAMVDVFQSLAFTCYHQDFTKPEILSEQKILHLEKAWHPLIKFKLKEEFVAHDFLLDEKNYFALITGPNMAGKTTVMREVAIIQFLAQLGCFVPAQKATVGLCDYLFSRLGATDDILKGHSTFMVEMAETAEILRHATSQSLIILDEIGRGTSTYDGLSIAWALSEHLVQKTQALTLFATHYHELIELIDSLEGAQNFTVETVSQKDTVLFLYRLIAGGAKQSFGINVAKLAGISAPILQRARHILHQLEQHHSPAIESTSQMEIPSHPLIQELSVLDLDQLTPMEALQKLHSWKKELPKH